MDMATTDLRLRLDELEILPLRSMDGVAEIPGSKSYTNRALAIASLADGVTTLENALLSEDTLYLLRAAAAFNRVDIAYSTKDSTVSIGPSDRPMTAPREDVYCGNAGTGLRFLTSMASLASGRTRITGNARMQERPVADLLDALVQLGVDARSVRGNGSPPVDIAGPSLSGGTARIRGTISSQFTSSVLISAPFAAKDVDLVVDGELISKPYVDMTLGSMAQFGVDVQRDEYHRFSVGAGQRYVGRHHVIEPDASGMSYFLAAAAILDGRVRVPGIGSGSFQGDVGLASVLAEMGCSVELEKEHITLEGGPLGGVEVDMSGMPDVVPTLAVVAAYARGTTHITGIANLRLKECDRIHAIVTELGRMGITVRAEADAITITGGNPRGATIDTYDDHRVAMSFAVAGLRTPGVVIRQPGCVVKSFPSFWQALDLLHERTGALR